MDSKIDLENEEKKKEFLENITKDNCGEKLKLIRDSSMMTKRDLAKVIGTSETTISRLEAGKTKPTADFMNRLLALVLIGHSNFKALTEKEKNNLIEYIAAAGATGIAAAIASLSSKGIRGLSAATVSYGVTAIGASVLGRTALIAAIPLSAGLVSYGLIKGIKSICEANKLNCTEIDDKYEIRTNEIK